MDLNRTKYTNWNLPVNYYKNLSHSSVASGLEDVSMYPELFDKLAEASETHAAWTRQELRNLAGENMLRVMLAVETYRDKVKDDNDQIKETRIPDEDLIDATCRTNATVAV